MQLPAHHPYVPRPCGAALANSDYHLTDVEDLIRWLNAPMEPLVCERGHVMEVTGDG
jgi:hypothetical protein